MSPYEQARQVYASEPCARTFEEDEHLHKTQGFLFCTPDFFVMGRAVFSKAEPAMIVDPRVRFTPDICDCWHLYLFAGDVVKAWSIMPWQLPLFSFERKNELRIYPADRIRRLCL